jgi:hypothetical protein
MMKRTLVMLVVVGGLWWFAGMGRADIAVEVEVSPERVESIEVFYTRLAPYGEWIVVPEYGKVWRPSIVVSDRGWRPYYTNGRWVRTRHGWYWKSNYVWGWAPFHFGRWVNARYHGWVWVPDVVWGPAWVHWRNSSTQYGWAPLPPEARYEVGVGFVYRGRHVSVEFNFNLADSDYVFLPIGHFVRPDPPRVVVVGPPIGPPPHPIGPPPHVVVIGPPIGPPPRVVGPPPRVVERAASRRAVAVSRTARIAARSSGSNSSGSTQEQVTYSGPASSAAPGSRSQRLRDALR